MEIKIYGSGCSRCTALYELTKKLVEENGIDAEVTKVTYFPTMLKKGILSLPAVEVDDQIKVVGRVPDAKELLSWLK